MTAPPGALVWLYYDGAATVQPGEYLRTTGTGRTYRVETARTQQRGKHTGRQHLACVVMDPADPLDDDAVVWPLRWYHRG